MACQLGWLSRCKQIEGVLSDITGVLYESGGGAIPGSADALKRLTEAGIPFKLVTNESETTREALVEKLNSMGFSLRADQLIAPAPAAASFIAERGWRPHLLVHPEVRCEFPEKIEGEPDCVVVGDCGEHFTFEAVNKAFQVLISHAPASRRLLSLGCGKYYKRGDELVIDVGAYTKALEYATDCEVLIFGKPNKLVFHAALKEIGVSDPSKAIMVGDDLHNDVAAAQAAGLIGIQVRTGKYQPSFEDHETIKPHAFVHNLKEAVDLLLGNR